jgi:putative ABC transport system permease protein
MDESRTMARVPRVGRSEVARTIALIGPLAEDGLAQLRAGWRQQLLTLAGIVWGSAAVILLLSLGAGFHAFLDIGFKKTGDRYSFVNGEYTTADSGGTRPGRHVQLLYDDLPRLRGSVPSAEHLAPEIDHGGIAVRTDFRTKTGILNGSTPEIQHIKVLRVARGRFYDEEDVLKGRPVAVLGANLPAEFFGTEDPIGRDIQIEGRPFRVIGVLEHKGPQLVVNNGLHDDMLWVPVTAAQRAFGLRDEIHQVIANPWSPQDVASMHGEIRAALSARHHVAPDDEQAFGFVSIAEFSQPVILIGLGLTVLLGAIGTVTLAMAGVGVANLMIALVNARRVEFAMRRACGARRSDLLLQLLVETAVVVGAGGVLGILLGLAIDLAIGLLPLPEMIPTPEVSVSVLGTTFAILAATGLLAGIVPAQRAARVDPATALRVR